MSAHDETAIRAVLWFFGDRINGWEPGSFIASLLVAISRADEDNRARLAGAYPELVEFVGIAQNVVGGMDQLVDALQVRS